MRCQDDHQHVRKQTPGGYAILPEAGEFYGGEGGRDAGEGGREGTAPASQDP